MAERRAVLIAGPTASGKSALAVEIAAQMGGIVVNADSMQVYQGLSVLTARPTAAEMGGVVHHLYGFVSPAIRFSAGMWLASVEKLIQDEELFDKPLIFVGGTGLYFESLIKGIAAVPAIPDKVIQAVEAEIAGLDRAERRALLEKRDPEMAALLAEPDRQRVVRALSVLQETGTSLAVWQARSGRGLLDGFAVHRKVLDPGRDVVRVRIAARFEAMMAGGAVEEVRALSALGLDPSLPAMKAIGVREIGAYLAGDLSRDEAMSRAVIASQQYAKRQRTWFRKYMADWDWS